MAQKFYRSPTRSSQRSQSAGTSPTPGRASAPESWASSARTSPFVPAGGLPSIRSPAFEPSSSRAEWRPTLPSLPSLTLDRGPTQIPQGRNSWTEYALDASRACQVKVSAFDPPHPGYSQGPTEFSYGYQQPRGQPYQGTIITHHQDRTPFSSNGYPHHYHKGYVAMNEVDGQMLNESKQRKRRGNLPKETTDKLRSWFVAHLQHPYPTEDEKQELMRQTGLQMSSLSPSPYLVYNETNPLSRRSNIKLVHQCPSSSTPSNDQ